VVVGFEEEADDREDHDGEGGHDDAVVRQAVRIELWGSEAISGGGCCAYHDQA
jgi:hypothetical protein